MAFLALGVSSALVYLGIYSAFWNVRFFAIGLALFCLVWMAVRRYSDDERVNPAHKAVLITGCDSGFGNALAKRLDSVGFHVFACCLFPEGSGAKELKQVCSSHLRVVPLDVTSDDSVSRAHAFVKDHIGSNSLWAVVNNAGISKGSAFDLSTIDHFKQTIDVNALGPVRVTKAFMPLLKESRGRVVNVTSYQACCPMPNICPYTMSKYAARAFTECLSLEMIPWRVRVINIEPGPFRTPIIDPKNVISRLKAEKEEIDENILSSYGDAYFQHMDEVVKIVGSYCSSNIDHVVDAMETAVTKIHAEHVYKPRCNIITRVVFGVYEKVPFSIQIKLLLVLFKFVNFPVPCAVKM